MQLKKILKTFYKRLKIYKRDLLNMLRFGWSAPLYNELIWVDPQKVEYMIERDEVKRVSGFHRSNASGVVVDWSEVKNIKPITDEFRIRYCYQHWKKGESWEELGVIDHMKSAKKYKDWPRDKIKDRFRMLDEAFEEVKEAERLKTRKEMDSSNFRETAGILIHIGSDGEPYFGGSGFHRLAMAKVLELRQMPAYVGLVDKDSIHHLKKYRNRNY